MSTSNDDLILRPETPSDVAAIRDVVDRAFGDRDTSRLVDLIRERGHARLATVAVSDGAVVGYILASPMSFDPPQTALHCLGIAPVAVTPDLQTRQIGSRLVRHAIAAAEVEGVDALFLLGHPTYYPRFGFAPTHIANEYGATDAFMALELRPGCLEGVAATVLYTGEFAEVGV